LKYLQFIININNRKIKTLLLFVIRDFTGRTPLSNLSEVLTNELNKMWKDIAKVEIKIIYTHLVI